MRLSFNWDLDHPIVLVGCELNYHSRHNDITYNNHAEKCFQDGSLMLFTSIYHICSTALCSSCGTTRQQLSVGLWRNKMVKEKMNKAGESVG